jgi:hypothetical protein
VPSGGRASRLGGNRRHSIPFSFHSVASLKYGAEALALIGIGFSMIKWVGRTLRSLISDSARETAQLEALSAPVPDAAFDALVRQGVVSADDLAGMTPRERDFLIAAAGQRVDGVGSREVSRRLTPSSMPTVGSAGVGAARRAGTPPRLHLITPSRPPLGVSVHCPGCGAALDRDALQRIGSATCPRCKRPVSAHIQRGRLTVIVDETPEEAEHRRRLDGHG